MSDGLLSQEEIDALLPRLTSTGNANQNGQTTLGALTGVPGKTGGNDTSVRNLERILEIPLNIKVYLGEATRTIQDILALIPGSIVEFERSVTNPIDIRLNGKLIARGEVVIVDEHFGVRITQIITPEDRLHKMG